jgi:uncharacterized protein (DUF1684 family)
VKKTLLFVILLLFASLSLSSADEIRDKLSAPSQMQKVLEWRERQYDFFKNHRRSPLLPKEKKYFKGLEYYPFDSKYCFPGPIERLILHINNPNYYATFLTNKGTNKRYIRYGKFRFSLDGKGYVIEIYKSILSDYLLIPFKDLTNGKGTYEGGRYIDGEILDGDRMILDFNMAYQPLCAYNDKFTCAIPPRENFLSVEIKAGEKNYK